MVTRAQGSPRLVSLRCGEQTRDGDRVAVLALLVREQGADRAVGRSRQDVIQTEERVVGDIEPEHVALVRQERRLVPLRKVRDGNRRAPTVGPGAFIEPGEE